MRSCGRTELTPEESSIAASTVDAGCSISPASRYAEANQVRYNAWLTRAPPARSETDLPRSATDAALVRSSARSSCTPTGSWVAAFDYGSRLWPPRPLLATHCGDSAPAQLLGTVEATPRCRRAWAAVPGDKGGDGGQWAARRCQPSLSLSIRRTAMAEPDQAPTPTASQIGTAAGLKSMHSASDRGTTCAWCFRQWPCRDRAWADRILTLARERAS